MLSDTQSNSLQRLPSKLDTGELDYESHNHNYEEERVVEEVFEDVYFLSFELTGVDFVEDLEQDESVEEVAIVLS